MRQLVGFVQEGANHALQRTNAENGTVTIRRQSRNLSDQTSTETILYMPSPA